MKKRIVRLHNVCFFLSKKSFLQSFKSHISAMQDPEVQKHLLTAQDVYDFIANFFDHRCGMHFNCLSEKCKIDGKPRAKDPRLTAEFCRQVQEVKKKYLKKLMK